MLNEIVYKIGVVSDTHSLLRPDLKNKLKGADLIIHAGDVGRYEIIKELEEIAPTTAIRGNVDKTDALLKLPSQKKLHLVNDLSVFVIHDINEFYSKPENADIIITGHTHKPEIKKQNDTLFINPGSAGPKRFHLPVTFALIDFIDGKIKPKIVELVD